MKHIVRGALAVAGALVITLGVIEPAPTLAAPSCDGHPATIVGTAGHDSIPGTRGNDVIVGLGGDDAIWGDTGADIICGGPGNDVIQGAGGADHLLGNGGEDDLRGQPGDDRIEGGRASDYLHGGEDDDRLAGGPGRDICLQAGGRGRMTRCENPSADLAIVAVDCPASATLGVPFECQVTLANHGPAAAHPVLANPPFPKDCHGSCAINILFATTGHTVDHPDAGALLAAGDERTDPIEVTITRWPGIETIQPAVVIIIRPVDVFDAIDPARGNDWASTPIERA